MIYIDEAHSDRWKIGLQEKHLPPQKDINDRLLRAKTFVEKEKCPYPVYVDTWSNDYALQTHSWPDRFFLIDKQWKILETSEYGSVGDADAKIILDCTVLLQQLLA